MGHTGTVTNVGLRSAGNASGSPMVAVRLLASFILGSAVCGMLIPKRRPTFTVGDKTYSLAFVLQAMLMVATCKAQDTNIGKYFACVACGLMNSITSSWSGGPLRSTHSTGPTTEVGLTLGRMASLSLLKGSAFDAMDR